MPFFAWLRLLQLQWDAVFLLQLLLQSYHMDVLLCIQYMQLTVPQVSATVSYQLLAGRFGKM
jgi:hypothetical protein